MPGALVWASTAPSTNWVSETSAAVTPAMTATRAAVTVPDLRAARARAIETTLGAVPAGLAE